MDVAIIPWVVALDGVQIIAVQHGCGVNGTPVNCYLDEYRNWVCPRCMDTYGAAVPLVAWSTTLTAESAKATSK